MQTNVGQSILQTTKIICLLIKSFPAIYFFVFFIHNSLISFLISHIILLDIMKTIISSINYCPVKSLSFQRISSCNIKKDIGIIGDRIFAFSKNLNIDKAKLVEKYPKIRK